MGCSKSETSPKFVDLKKTPSLVLTGVLQKLPGSEQNNPNNYQSWFTLKLEKPVSFINSEAKSCDGTYDSVEVWVPGYTALDALVNKTVTISGSVGCPRGINVIETIDFSKNDGQVLKAAIDESKRIEDNNKLRTLEPWFSINIGKMENTLINDKDAFIMRYVEKPEFYTSDCLKESDPSSMISFLKDSRNYGPNEMPNTEIIENIIIGNIPIDITVRHVNKVEGTSTTKLDMRYIRGKDECKKVFTSIVGPYKDKIQESTNSSKALGDRYK